MSFLSTTRTAVCAAALLVGAGALVAHAQDAADPAAPAAGTAPAAEAAPAAAAPEPPRNPTDVVARVGDETITEAELVIAEEAFASELGDVPPEQKRSVLIDAMVNLELVAQAAREAGLDKGPDYENRLAFIQMQALRNAYIKSKVVDSLTPEELQKAYQDVVVKQHTPVEEVHARHILVDTEEAAKKIIADLKGGASFEELAKQSKDPSGENGGDLGFFARGSMVPPFEEAAFKLEPGKITEEPVKSEFGWHVIKLEEKRMTQPPEMAEIEEDLRQFLLRQKFQDAMASLRQTYKVEVIGEPAASEGEATPAVVEPAPMDGQPVSGEEPATGEQPAN